MTQQQPTWGVRLSKYKFFPDWCITLLLPPRFADFLIPQRVILAIMGFLAILNAYTMRISLSIAITELVVKKNHSEIGDTAVCPADDLDSESSSGGEYEWSEELQGLILSSFYIGYIVTHIPGGLLAEKFGGKWTLGLGILSTAFFTLITPIAITEGGSTALIIVRILMGLGEGTTFPALSVLLSQWVPIKERGKLGALVLGGGQVGTILGNLLSGVLLDAYDWPVVFYLFGGLGVVWFIFFCFLCFSDPASHPYIKPSEREYLEREMGSIVRNDNLPPTPWKAILTSMPMIALVCAQIGHDWGFYIMVTDLPKYMSDVMQFSIKANGLYSSLPYVMMWIFSISSGFVGDWLMTRGILNITNTRKLMTGIAAFGPAIFMVAASYAGCDRVAVVVLFTICMGLMGAFYAGMKLSPLDMSPNYAGTLMAITNGIGAITGVITPYLVGVMTPNATLLEWRLVFWVAFAVLVVTAIIYSIWASGEVQPYNDPQPKNKDFETEERAEKKNNENTSDYQQKPQPQWGVKLSNYIFIPQRFILMIMGFFAAVNAYTMRICLSMTIPALVIPRNYSDENFSTTHCPIVGTNFKETEMPISGTHNWSQSLQGFILSSFYIGYVITHIPGGEFAKTFGAKWVLSLGLLFTAIFTLLTPLTINFAEHVGLVIIRILMGLGEGTTFPALTFLIANWVPKNERGVIGAAILGGGQMGTIIGNLLSGYLLTKSTWPSVFYTFGGLTILWFIFFTCFCFSDPASHPFIRLSEKEYLIQKMGLIARRRDLGFTPWKQIFTSMPVYAMLVAQVGHDWAFYILVTDLPKYLNDVMQIPIRTNALYSSLPFALMWIISIIAGIISDYFIKHEFLSITVVRKIMTSVGAIAPALFSILASFAGCDKFQVILHFCLCLGSMGFYYAGVRLTPNDLSPNYSGILMAITNGIGAFTGILAPYSVGLMTPNTTIQEWRLVFCVAAFILFSSAVFFCICGTGEIQPWNEPKPKN
ncbi:uncharacterized protein ACRADG_004794 [Cochliomyia hominivorax]